MFILNLDTDIPCPVESLLWSWRYCSFYFLTNWCHMEYTKIYFNVPTHVSSRPQLDPWAHQSHSQRSVQSRHWCHCIHWPRVAGEHPETHSTALSQIITLKMMGNIWDARRQQTYPLFLMPCACSELCEQWEKDQ